MSKEIAVTTSLQAASVALSTPAPKGFGCFLARYIGWMVEGGDSRVSELAGDTGAALGNSHRVRGRE